MARSVMGRKMTKAELKARLQAALACITTHSLIDHLGDRDVVSYPAAWGGDLAATGRATIRCPHRMPGRVMALRVALEHVTDGAIVIPATPPRTLPAAVVLLDALEIEVL